MTEGLVFAQQANSIAGILEFLGTNTWMLHVYAIVLLAGFTWVLNRFLRGGRRQARGPGIGWLVLGADKRVSTSKVQVVLWSYAIAFALLSLIFHRALPTDLNLDGTYLVLLGSPAAAALLSKGITTAKARNGTIAKPSAREAPSGLGAGVAQVVSDDEGRVEVFDLQYFLFTLVALTFFAFAFLAQDFGSAAGLPDLPLELVALTGASAATYVVRKGVENEEPVLTGAYPETVFPGETVRIRGKNLAFDIPGAEPVEPEAVLFGGRRAELLPPYSSGSVEARVPENLEAGSVSVRLMRSDGVFAAEELDLRIVVQKPRITAVQPTRIVLGVDQHVVVYGTRFGDPGRDGTPGILLDGRELRVIEDKDWGPTTIRAKLPAAAEAEEQGYKLPGTAELIVLDARGQRSAAETVQLEAKRAKPVDPERVDGESRVNTGGNDRIDTAGNGGVSTDGREDRVNPQDPPQPRPLPHS